jgi:hypothetical protein
MALGCSSPVRVGRVQEEDRTVHRAERGAPIEMGQLGWRWRHSDRLVRGGVSQVGKGTRSAMCGDVGGGSDRR